MAIQLKDTKFGDTIVTKTSGMYSFDAVVDTTGGFSVTSGDGRVFSVDEGGAITGASLAVAGGFSADGISAGSGGVSMSNVNVGSGVFEADASGHVLARNELSIVDETGSTLSTIGSGSLSIGRMTPSGMQQVFTVRSATICGEGISLYNGSGNIVFNAYDGKLSVCGYSYSEKGMRPVFDVSQNLLELSNEHGTVLQTGNDYLYLRNSTSSGQNSRFSADSCGMSYYSDDGYRVFYAGLGNLKIRDSSPGQGYYTRFSADSSGIYVNLGNASGRITTTSVPGSSGGSVTVLTLA